MKWRYWIGIWCFLLIVSLIVGFRTRASYTDRMSDWPTVLNAQYLYNNGTIGSASNINYHTLESQSQLVVKCSFTGVRKAENQCYLSTLTISQVYKGSKMLRGETIQVFEPVSTIKFSANNLKALDDPNNKSMYQEYIELNQKFDIDGKNDYLESMNYMSDGFGHSTMFVTGHNYLLFLVPKQSSSSTTYLLIDSPYAKLTLDSGVTAKTYLQPPKIISMKESLNYEILLKDSKSIGAFFKIKQSILSNLGLC